jgi:hypothetical protein
MLRSSCDSEDDDEEGNGEAMMRIKMMLLPIMIGLCPASLWPP